ncbi:transcriptional regulator PpsR [Sphingomonas sp. TREG-RG-20F-R18-01]|uniref:transcriptional regulator PpsR n=1 Tax=Sphingomonas sp. TREG-RG-20F-R18-01 TaxID=2914982 RepID=UPI001F591C46|nr:transcriptional regulator PpsR [Sphingomonas sp. TREG-RG-20F-R18-01]
MNDRPTLFAPHAFTNPDALAETLAPRVAAAVVAAAGDIALVVDPAGVIRDVAIANADLAALGFGDWRGHAWIDTVTSESRAKITDMLSDGAAREPSRWRQINHPTAGGDVPVRYLVTQLEQGGGVLAIGRDMRAAAVMQQRLLQTQQSLERDYIKLRQAEARYRLLFDLGTEPVLIIDVATRRIREINPAAARLIGAVDDTLTDQPVTTIVDPADREDLIAQLGAAGASDDLPAISVRLASGQPVAMSARLFRQGRVALLLVRLVPDAPSPGTQGHAAPIGAVIEHMPDAFVLVDARLDILFANAAFTELAGVASVARVTNAPLATWLGRPGIDLELIVGQLREHGTVRNVATILRSTGGRQEEIEISGVVAPYGDSQCYGFTIRNVARRLRSVPPAERDLPRSVEQLTELVGRMSLKDIVRESTDLIERLCIEAALAYTSDNRASAAEILGISRQSLYSKLHRHGLGNLVSGEG